MLRRIAALIAMLMVLGATLAPSIASATAPIPGLCRCASHEHCPASRGQHTCRMPQENAGPAFEHCESTTLLSLPADLPPVILPSVVDAPSLPCVLVSAPAFLAPLSRTDAPEPPPPRS